MPVPANKMELFRTQNYAYTRGLIRFSNCAGLSRLVHLNTHRNSHERIIQLNSCEAIQHIISWYISYCQQQRLRGACAHAQTRQCLRCSHNQGMDVDKDQTSDPASLGMPECVFIGSFCAYAICTKTS